MFVPKYKEILYSPEDSEIYRKKIWERNPSFSTFGLLGAQGVKTVNFYLENFCREVVLWGIKGKDYVSMTYFDERINCMVIKNIPLALIEDYVYISSEKEAKAFSRKIEYYPAEKEVSIENSKEFCYSMNENFNEKRKGTIFYERINLEDSICEYSKLLLRYMVTAYRLMAGRVAPTLAT